MMRLQTYAGISLVATLVVIYHAFHSRGQFYPAMVHLSTSKISLVLLLNMGLVIMCILWQITKRVFLGSLREAEIERLNEQSWREVMEILFAITIFRQDFSVAFLAMVTALLLIKALHWLAQKRVEYIETTPAVTTLSHIRIVSFMGFLLLIDSLFLYSSIKYLIQTRQASVSFFFSFENYGVPLHLIRDLYETFRNFRIRVADYVRYRKITSNMNDRFPDATHEELNASDATCIICREEMTTAKRLSCGHLFHVHCLRSWLERQHTHVLLAEPLLHHLKMGLLLLDHKQVLINKEQARLQAAAAAASIYEKSFVYPSINTSAWSPGYALLPQAYRPLDGTVNAESSGERSFDGQSQQHPSAIPVGPANLATPQSSYSSFVTCFAPDSDNLQNQLHLLQKSRTERSMDVSATSPSDCKGKAVASSSSSVSDCIQHGETEEIENR
ncbi:RING/U-box superfamily protein [Actinidia rufa]|uniref:RING-type E3 ubiquitin transferase n=1 Tax=Actinidia rufa TaxID=165716 RepID=A0A7J0EC29_9ERIC|nr:RING/U-box superfamily protein [Actinidia rufa]